MLKFNNTEIVLQEKSEKFEVKVEHIENIGETEMGAMRTNDGSEESDTIERSSSQADINQDVQVNFARQIVQANDTAECSSQEVNINSNIQASHEIDNTRENDTANWCNQQANNIGERGQWDVNITHSTRRNGGWNTNSEASNRQSPSGWSSDMRETTPFEVRAQSTSNRYEPECSPISNASPIQFQRRPCTPFVYDRESNTSSHNSNYQNLNNIRLGTPDSNSDNNRDSHTSDNLPCAKNYEKFIAEIREIINSDRKTIIIYKPENVNIS